jgi:UDP-N-acetylglucosamine 2-epimerase
VGSRPENIVREFNKVIRREQEPSCSPRYWDGNAAKRIVKILANDFFADRAPVEKVWQSETEAKEFIQN